MTKEELKKEAEEESFRYVLDKPWACYVEKKQIMGHFEKGYIAGAEPREKRIAELEQENTRLKLELEALDGQIPWKDIKDKSEVLGKLTEAKDIIRQLLLLPYANNEEVYADITSLLNKAEQFIKE